MNHGKRGIRLSPKKCQVWCFQLSSLSVVMNRTHFSQQWCVTIYTKYCQPSKLTCALVSRVCIGTQLCRHYWPLAYWLKILAPLETELILSDPKPSPEMWKIPNILKQHISRWLIDKKEIKNEISNYFIWIKRKTKHIKNCEMQLRWNKAKMRTHTNTYTYIYAYLWNIYKYMKYLVSLELIIRHTYVYIFMLFQIFLSIFVMMLHIFNHIRLYGFLHESNYPTALCLK